VATLYDSYFPPTVATPAAASPATVTATSTSLSALGASVAGASSLTYTWATTGTPPAPVTFSANGTTAAASTTATFNKAGTYAFQVTITDALGRTVTSSVNVTVNQTLTSITVSPAPANLNSSSTQQFTAVADDQFGNALTVQPALNWSVIGGGSITGNGLYTPPYSSGSATVYGTSGGLAGMASVTYSGQAQWASASGGTWGGSGNWQDTSSGTVLAAAPGVRGIIGDTALFSSAAGSTITLGSADPNLAGLTFNSGSNGFTIAPGEAGGTLTLDNGTASVNIAVAAGSQTISAPVVLESNVVVAPAAGSRLTMSGPISGTGGALALNGAGTLILSGANHYGGTTVAEGTLVVANSSALGAGSSLVVGAGAGLLFASPLEASPAAAATPVTASNAASVMAQAANSTFNFDRHDKQFPTVQALDAVFAQYGRG
jgi:autotransporter-associated beta strand protein